MGFGLCPFLHYPCCTCRGVWAPPIGVDWLPECRSNELEFDRLLCLMGSSIFFSHPHSSYFSWSWKFSNLMDMAWFLNLLRILSVCPCSYVHACVSACMHGGPKDDLVHELRYHVHVSTVILSKLYIQLYILNIIMRQFIYLLCT